MGIGGAALAGGSIGGLALTAAQDATPAPSRPVGGPSVEQKAFDLEYDIEKIFRFVADEVRYEAYPGVLRGAKGALGGLAANSADQALLLTALLNESLVVTRFVIGEIEEATAAGLLDGMRLDEASSVLEVARAHVAALPPDPAKPVEMTPELQATVDLMGSAYEVATATAERRLTDSLDGIGGALDSVSLRLPDPSFEFPDLERRHHVWLQYADGSLWIDLDPSLTGAEPGKVAAEATETVETLPPEWQHACRFRVVIEESAGGTIARRELLRHEAPSQDLIGMPIAFAHVNPDAFKSAGLAIVEAISGTATLYPSLVIGPDVIVDQPIRVGSAAGALDALGESATASDALAEWLEFDIISPGADPVTVTRTLFDRGGAVKRAAGEIVAGDVPAAELIDLAGVGPTYPPLLGLILLSVAAARLPAMMVMQQEFAIDDLLADLSLLGVGYQSLLDSFAADLLIPRGTRLYMNAPNVLAVTIDVTDASSADPDFALGIDLIHRTFGFTPVADRPLARHPGMLAGIVSHVAERALLDTSWATDLGVTALPTTDRSVGRVFEEATRQGIDILTILPDGAVVSDGPTGVAPDVQVLLDQAHGDGWIVIVPERPVDVDDTPTIGWWLVDPVTGKARDQFETGQEATLVEYGQRVAQFLYGPLPKFRSLGCAIAGIALAGSILAYAGATAAAYDAATNPTASTASKVAAVLGLGAGTGGLAGGLLGPLAGCR